MVEAALNAAAEQVVEFGASGHGARAGMATGARGAAPQGVYPCAGDDRWLAIAVSTDDQWTARWRGPGPPVVDVGPPHSPTGPDGVATTT